MRAARVPVLRADERLFPREREVVALACAGWRNPEIARCLCLSIKTVEAHLDGAMRKLECRTVRQLCAAYARGAPGRAA